MFTGGGMSTKPKVLGQLELDTFVNIRQQRAVVLAKVSELLNELQSSDNQIKRRIFGSVEKYCSVRVLDLIVGLDVVEQLITQAHFVDTVTCGDGAQHCFTSVASAMSELKTLAQVFAGVAEVQVERVGKNGVKISIRTLPYQ